MADGYKQIGQGNRRFGDLHQSSEVRKNFIELAALKETKRRKFFLIF